LSQALLVAVIGAAALAGCRKDEPAPVVPPTTPAETAPTAPSPAPMATPPASAGTVTLGNAIGANNAIATPMSSFSTGDTIHASVATNGTAGSRLVAKWT